MAGIRNQPITIKSLHRLRDAMDTSPDLSLLSTGGKIKFYVDRTNLSYTKGHIQVCDNRLIGSFEFRMIFIK